MGVRDHKTSQYCIDLGRTQITIIHRQVTQRTMQSTGATQDPTSLYAPRPVLYLNGKTLGTFPTPLGSSIHQ